MAEPLVPKQQQFAASLSAQTGLGPRVVGAWLKAEQSGSAASYYEGKGYNNWLNIARTDSGDAAGAHSGVWRSPQSAARATAQWLKGEGPISQEYGKPAPGIRAILNTRGQSPQAQIAAIGRSGWATAPDYGSKIGALFHELAGDHGLVQEAQRASGAPRAGGASTEQVTTNTPATSSLAQSQTIASLLSSLSQPQQQVSVAGTPLARPATSGGPEQSAESPHVPAPITPVVPPAQPDVAKILSTLGAQETPATSKTESREIKAGGGLGATQGAPGAEAVKFGVQHLGKYAESEGNNLGPELNQLEARFGIKGEPWCAVFATAAAHNGGASPATRTASVASINEWAAQGSHGYEKGLRPSSQAQPGDLLTFGDQHVALVKERRGNTIVTIEGNADGSGGVIQSQHRVGEGQIARPKYG